MARTSFAQLLELEQQGFEPLQMLAEAAYVWADLGELEKAQQIFEALDVIAPDDPVSQLGLASVRLARGEFRQAETAAKQAARRGNRSPATVALAYNLQGDALMGQNKPSEAQQAWRRAQRADPSGAGGSGAEQRINAARAAGLEPQTPPDARK